MKKTMKIEGLHCGGCDGRLKRILEAIDGVTEATADHVTGTAVVVMDKDVPNETLKAAAEGGNFTVLGIE